uniref:Uncharacterized protein n=1 Tax=Ditylenchus dipsaci TaxID=166011 RepID=A0A915EMJ2_9BILA
MQTTSVSPSIVIFKLKPVERISLASHCTRFSHNFALNYIVTQSGNDHPSAVTQTLLNIYIPHQNYHCPDSELKAMRRQLESSMIIKREAQLYQDLDILPSAQPNSFDHFPSPLAKLQKLPHLEELSCSGSIASAKTGDKILSSECNS